MSLYSTIGEDRKMKYVKFSISVIVILFGFGMMQGVINTTIIPRLSEEPNALVDVIFYLVPLIITYLLIQYSWRKIIKEAKNEEKNLSSVDLFQSVKKSIDTIRSKGSMSKITIEEESIYEQVAEELASNIKKEGLWLKAIEQSEGDEKKTHSYYIKYRVESIKKDLQQKLAEQQQRLSEAELQIISNMGTIHRSENKRFQNYKEDVVNVFKAIAATFAFIFIIALISSIFENNKENKVTSKIIPEISNLRWMDVPACTSSLHSTHGAQTYCSDYEMRLPTKDELILLLNYKDRLEYVNDAGYITEDGSVVNFKDHSVYDSGGFGYLVRCVSDVNKSKI